jgi:hypothetical protein
MKKFYLRIYIFTCKVEDWMRQGDFHCTEIELPKKEKERKTERKKKVAQIKTISFISFHLST